MRHTVLALSFCVLAALSFSQEEFERSDVGPEVSWLRTAYEVDVAVPDLPVATVTIACTADDYSGSITPYPGAAVEPWLTNAHAHVIFYNGQNRTVVDPGTYVIYGSHVAYPAVNSYQASIHANLHCLDYANTIRKDFPVTASVKARIPVKELHARKSKTERDEALADGRTLTIKAGEAVTFQIILSAIAPESDTRVDLDWSGDTSVLDSEPPFVPVSWKTDLVEFVSKSKLRTTGKVHLTAKTIGNAQSVTIVVKR